MSQFADNIINWQKQYGRHDLPWQQNITPYRVWLSEIMLQQTQVATVKPYYQRFLELFPTVRSLAEAELDDVYILWSGLGYYSRARNLHACAKVIAHEFGGNFPMDLDALKKLPGIGAYTAGAIYSICSNQPAVALDGNVRRILARHEAYPECPGSPKVTQHLTSIMEAYLPTLNGRTLTQGLFDLGSMICTRSKPKCDLCPVNSSCNAFQENKVNEFPKTKPAKKKPVKNGLFIVVLCQDEIGLIRHFDKGVWQGLWRPLWLEPINGVSEKLDTTPVEGGYLKHVFSHYQLNMELVMYQADTKSALEELLCQDSHNASEITWLTVSDALKTGLPAPVKTLLQLLNATQSLPIA